MLTHLSLKDFVIVKELSLDLSSGLTVLTGETGAGKSILIDALQMVLGARADTGVIREGAKQTDITAIFDVNDDVLELLREGALTDNDDLLEKTAIIRRVIDANGRSRSWINGIAVTASQVKEVAAKLLDMINMTEYAQGRMIKGGPDTRSGGSADDWMLDKYDAAKDKYVWNDFYAYHIDEATGNVYRKVAEQYRKNPDDIWRIMNAVDWQKEIYSTALSQNYNITVNGGSDKITYFTSASYKNIEGLVQGTGLRQGDLRVNLNADLSNTVKLAVSLNGSLKENDMMAGGI